MKTHVTKPPIEEMITSGKLPSSEVLVKIRKQNLLDDASPDVFYMIIRLREKHTAIQSPETDGTLEGDRAALLALFDSAGQALEYFHG